MATRVKRDYSLRGANAEPIALDAEQIEDTVEANWWHPDIPRKHLKSLMKRTDAYAGIDFALWIILLIVTAYFAFLSWGTWWAIPAFFIYGTIYTSSDARWHELGHGTPFKSRRLNEFFYHVCSFMTLREAYLWRWSHARHHTNTYIVGLDPEIQVQRPADLLKILLDFFYLMSGPPEVIRIVRHALGMPDSNVKHFVPESERPKMYWSSRVYVAIFIGLAIFSWQIGSFLPMMFVGLPRFYCGWFHQILGLTQHAGLGEDTYDHRENTRTVYVNPIFQYLYMNMNYHLEHHVIPMVPYHRLPDLHDAVKDQTPPAYHNLWEVYQEMIPTLIKQAFADSDYHIERPLPDAGTRVESIDIPMGSTMTSTKDIDKDTAPVAKNDTSKEIDEVDTWVLACAADDLDEEDILSFSHCGKLYAVYRLLDDDYYATDGLCTHEQVELSDGLVMDGCIECPMHNGRFNVADGKALAPPVHTDLQTYAVDIRDGKVYINITN